MTDLNPGGHQAGPEFVAWAKHHDAEKKAYRPDRAKASEQHNPEGTATAIHGEQAWAARRDHEHRLHDSAIEQMKPHDR